MWQVTNYYHLLVNQTGQCLVLQGPNSAHFFGRTTAQGVGLYREHASLRTHTERGETLPQIWGWPCFPAGDTEMSLCRMLIRHHPLWRGGMEAGGARGRRWARCRLSSSCGWPHPMGSSGAGWLVRAGLLCAKMARPLYPYIGPPWQAQDPGWGGFLQVNTPREHLEAIDLTALPGARQQVFPDWGLGSTRLCPRTVGTTPKTTLMLTPSIQLSGMGTR